VISDNYHGQAKMKREFLFDIQKYLDHFVNRCCDPNITWTLGGIETLPPPHAAVGVNILLSHHRKTPPDKGLSAAKQEYFVLDFQDFLASGRDLPHATNPLLANRGKGCDLQPLPVLHQNYTQEFPQTIRRARPAMQAD